jgi:hypothetical protein
MNFPYSPQTKKGLVPAEKFYYSLRTVLGSAFRKKDVNDFMSRTKLPEAQAGCKRKNSF